MSMGLRHCRSMGMEGSTGNLREFRISPSNTNAIYSGDLVRLASGFVVEASGAATGADFEALGVFMGVRYVDPEGGYQYRKHWDGGAGRTNCWAHVAVATGATFMIAGQAGATYTQADIGTRKGIVYAAGNPVTGFSAARLGAPGATVGTGPLKVIQAIDDVDPGGPYFEVEIVRTQALPAAA
jgi:hypothetical protein